MRKLLVVLWVIAACLLAAGFLRPVAYDAEVSSSTWCQVVVVDGSVRLMAVHGDPSASPVAADVFEREKNTWRNVVSGEMWGRADRWSGSVDMLGTVMVTYRLDIPLPLVLILIPMLPAGFWAFKRYRAPPRLIWRELRTRPPGRSRLGNIAASLVLTSFLSAALALIVLRIASYTGVPSKLSCFRDWGALVLPLARSDAELWAGPPRAPTLAARDRFESVGSGGRYFCIEVLLGGRVAFRSFSSQPNLGKGLRRWSHEIAGIQFSTMFTFGPRVLGYLSSDYLSQVMSGGNARTAPLGIETSLTIPLSWLGALTLIYPLVVLFRGPLRRARWRATGCCRWCGYDLTGNESGVCPECGEDATYPT